MRLLRLLGLVSVFCLASIASSAQQTSPIVTPPTTSDPQAVALIQRALTALVGRVTISDVTLTGSARRIAGSDDETGTATLTATGAGDSKLKLNLPSGARIEIRNHSAVPLPDSFPKGVNLPTSVTEAAQPAGAAMGPDGEMHGIASHNLMTDPAWFFPPLTLANVASPIYVVSYIGQETLNGAPVVHVSASRPLAISSSTPPPPGPPGTSFAAFMQELSQMDIYLDPTTLLPVALAFNTHPDANALVDLLVQIQFSNYQNTSTIEVPLHVQKFLNNSLVLDLQFDNVTLNSGLSASTYQMQ